MPIVNGVERATKDTKSRWFHQNVSVLDSVESLFETGSARLLLKVACHIASLSVASPCPVAAEIGNI